MDREERVTHMVCMAAEKLKGHVVCVGVMSPGNREECASGASQVMHQLGFWDSRTSLLLSSPRRPALRCSTHTPSRRQSQAV